MKKNLLILLVLSVFCFLNAIDLNQPIKMDPAVKVGKLSNGLTYYIMKNKTPEKQAILRLVVNAGSLLENDDQRGLAHFCEHMSFNGTLNYQKSALTDYLNSIGMGFATGLNAGTNYDQTVYMLKSSTEDKKQLKNAVFILSEWAHNVAYDDNEIEKERGVIIEEWRGGRGAQDRIRDQHWKVLFKGSKYPDRKTIGTYEVLSTFKHETIKDFYKTWYRPDLQAVVVVGDIDISEIENYISVYFSKIPAPKNPKPRPDEFIPHQNKTQISIVKDKETSNTDYAIYYKNDRLPILTLNDYKYGLANFVVSNMVNLRLAEIAQKPDSPLQYAYMFKFPIVRKLETLMAMFRVKDNKYEEALRDFLIEKEKIVRYGFTQTELDRTLIEIEKNIVNQANEKDKIESSQLADDLGNVYLSGNSFINDVEKLTLFQELKPEFTLAFVNQVAIAELSNPDRVVTLTMPDKEGIDVPTIEKLEKIILETESSTVQEYKDSLVSASLMEIIPEKGSIVSRKSIKEGNITQLILSNGLKVFYKKTDFKNNEILFDSYSPGGLVTADSSDYISALNSPGLIYYSGLGDFDNISLRKILSSHITQIYPTINRYSENLEGSFSIEDTEIAFQLIHLYFTKIRKDPAAFQTYMSMINSIIKNSYLDPNHLYTNEVNSALYKNNIYTTEVDTLNVNGINMNKAYQFFEERFSDPADFSFYFVGSIDEKSFEDLLLTYIASIPSKNKTEKIMDRHIRYAKGITEKTVNAGLEPKSDISIIISSDYNYSKKNNLTTLAMNFVLNEMLREKIREEMSGVYSVYSDYDYERAPYEQAKIEINLGCSPDRVEELTQAIYQIIDDLKTKPVDEKYMITFRQSMLKSFDTAVKQNDFWLGNIKKYDSNHLSPKDFLNTKEYINAITKKDVQKAAINLLNYKTNRIRVVLYPKNNK